MNNAGELPGQSPPTQPPSNNPPPPPPTDSKPHATLYMGTFQIIAMPYYGEMPKSGSFPGVPAQA